MNDDKPDKTKIAPRLTPKGDKTRIATRDKSQGIQVSSVLPEALTRRFTFFERLPKEGAEAEIFKVSPVDDSSVTRIIKLYRRGIKPKSEVIESIKSLESDYIVQVFEHGPVGEDQYFELQEYTEFGSLFELIWGHQITLDDQIFDVPIAYNDADIYIIFCEMFNAITYINQNDLIHRDVKPDNILVRSLQPLELVLADFGLARAAGVGGVTEREQGTPYYMAPEALAYEYYPFKTDIWAVGVIVYELLRQRHPFLGLGIGVIKNQLVKTRTPIVVENVSEPWKVLLEGLLQKRLEWRWEPNEVQAWLDAHEVRNNVIARIREYTPPARIETRFDVPFNFQREDGMVVGIMSRNEMALLFAENPKRANAELGRGNLERFFAERGAQQSDPVLGELARNLKMLENKEFAGTALQREMEVNLELVMLLNSEMPPYLMGQRVSLENLDAILQASAQHFNQVLSSIGFVSNEANTLIVKHILFHGFFGRYAELFTGEVAFVYRELQNEISTQLHEYQAALTVNVPGEAEPKLTKQYQKLKGPIDSTLAAKEVVNAWHHCVKMLTHCIQKMKLRESKARAQFEQEACEKLREGKHYGLAVHASWYSTIGLPSKSGFSKLMVLNHFFLMARLDAASKNLAEFKTMYQSIEVISRQQGIQVSNFDVGRNQLMVALESPGQVQEISESARRVQQVIQNVTNTVKEREASCKFEEEGLVNSVNWDDKSTKLREWLSQWSTPRGFIDDFCLHTFASFFRQYVEHAQVEQLAFIEIKLSEREAVRAKTYLENEKQKTKDLARKLDVAVVLLTLILFPWILHFDRSGYFFHSNPIKDIASYKFPQINLGAVAALVIIALVFWPAALLILAIILIYGIYMMLNGQGLLRDILIYFVKITLISIPLITKFFLIKQYENRQSLLLSRIFLYLICFLIMFLMNRIPFLR